MVHSKQAISKLFKALSHPARLSMVKGLLENECNVNKIVKELNMPQSTVSQHLSVLSNAGIIKGERKGVSVCYKVIDPFVKELIRLIDRGGF